MTVLAKNLQRTHIGRIFIAVRDNDLAAEVMGVNLFRYKLLAFFIGCFFAGIAGWLWANYMGVC
jgi:branched-chain amino acid transport system permease protein